TASRYAFSRAVGALAWRAAGVGASLASAARALSTFSLYQSGWLYDIASPQYAIANAGSRRCASLKTRMASSYSKLCSRSTPRTNGACAGGVLDVGKE